MPVVLMYPATFEAPPSFTLASITYPLDLVAGATGAWSLRKLAVAYAGNCLKVRRSSDNATQDIGFSGSYCDFAALSAFVGSGDGFADTVYDQTGNGRDLVQSTTTLQPQVMASGAYFTTIGGYPGLDYASRYLESSVGQSAFITTTTGTVFALWNADTAISTGTGNTIHCNRGGWNGMFLKDVSGTVTIRALGGGGGTEHFAEGAPYPTGAAHVTVWQHGSSTQYLYVDGNTAISSTSSGAETGNGTAHFCWGRDANTVAGSNVWDGRMSELITYSADLSSGDRGTIGAAMAVPFGLTWS